MALMPGSQKQMFDVMQLYFMAARSQGRLTTGVELATVIGAAMAQIWTADPKWARECALDAWRMSGLKDEDWWAAVEQAKDVIRECQARQMPMPEIVEMEKARARKVGLL